MGSAMTESLKLPPIPVPRGRSPGSSPDVRRRSKEREEQRRLRAGQQGDHHGFRLPCLFRGRSMSNATPYLAYSLTNLSEITGPDEAHNDGTDLSPSPRYDTTKMSSKWPLMKTLSGASTRTNCYQSSASSTPGGRRSPKPSSPKGASTLAAPGTQKQRSQSHSHRFPFNFTFGLGGGSSNESTDRQTHFKNIYDSKGNWIGFVQRKTTGDQSIRAWNNQTTFFTRARSADDIFQVSVDDLVEA